MRTVTIIFLLFFSSIFVLSFGVISNEDAVTNFKKYNMNFRKHLANVQDLDDSNAEITKLRNAIANPCENDCKEF